MKISKKIFNMFMVIVIISSVLSMPVQANPYPFDKDTYDPATGAYTMEINWDYYYSYDSFLGPTKIGIGNYFPMAANRLNFSLSDIKSFELTNGYLEGDDIRWMRDYLPNLETLKLTKYGKFTEYTYNPITGTTTYIHEFGENGFYNHKNIKTVKDLYNYGMNVEYIGVKHIRDYAFNSCPKLTTVDLPGVETLGVGVFSNSTALPKINLPRLQSVNNYSFLGCTALTEVNLPSVTRVELQSFMGCTALPSISLPKAEYIGTDAFKNSTALQSVNLPKVTEIGWSAFYDCTALESISLPSVKTIYNYAFNNNTSLTKAAFPEVTSFNDWAFSDCSSLTLMELGATPPSVGYNAFYINPVNPPINRTIYVPQSAVSNYKNDNRDGNTSDSYWHGWLIAEPVTISATATDATTYLGSDGKIQVLAQGGTGIYQYSKDGGSSWLSESEFTGLPAGNYNVQVKDSTGYLSNIASVNVSFPDRVTTSVIKTDVTDYGESQGSITVTAIGGTSGTYQYSIDNCVSWQDENTFLDLVAGSYKVFARDKLDTGNISLLNNVVISQPEDVTFTVSKIDSSIYEGNTGSITVNALGGKGSYEYSIDAGNSWQDSNIFSDLYVGTYQVKVRDKVDTSNISATSNITLTQPDQLIISVYESGVTSMGRSDGSISIIALGGKGTYEFSIDGGTAWQDNNAFNGLSANTYEVVARDKEDIENISDISMTTVTYPEQVTITISKTNVTTKGANDGSISITPTGGKGTYEYSVDGGTSWQDNNAFNGLSTGSYKVFARDKADTANTSGISVVTINNPYIAPPAVISSSTEKDERIDIAVTTSNGKPLFTAAMTSTIEALEVMMSREAFNKISESTDIKLVIDEGIGTITFDADVVDNIGKSSDTGDITLEIKQVNPSTLSEEDQKKVDGHLVYDFTLMVGDTQISNLGGRVSISIPYTLGSVKNSNAVVVYYIDDSGNLKTIRGMYNNITNTVDFITTHFSKYAVGYNEVSFADVTKDSWYYDAVTFIGARGITSGIGNSMFGSENTLTRGQFIVMLMRAYQIEADENPIDNFDDGGDTYYTNYLATAKALGITKGIGNNMYAPELTISRQDMFTLLHRALELLGELPEETDNTGSTLSDYSDAGEVSDYAQTAMEYFVERGIISGSNGKLSPSGQSTRAQMVQVLYNLLSK